jgi:hypothetical protein
LLLVGVGQADSLFPVGGVLGVGLLPVGGVLGVGLFPVGTGALD